MTDREDIEMLAAEYVLGTLDEAERAEAAARRRIEPDLHNAISDWEVKLSPMLDGVADAVPRADLLARIEQRIADQSSRQGSTRTDSANIISLRRQLIGWRMIAAVLAGIILYSYSDAFLPVGDQTYVAVFQENDQPPQFLLSIDQGTRELTIRPVAAQMRRDKTYQLWIVVDEPGADPRSLGLLDKLDKTTRKQLNQFDFKTLEAATFGISLEPEGGSPTGKPTGPALHGKLIPATS